MLKTISAYEARKNFGELMNLAYYNNYEIVVEKMGKPMIKITKAPVSLTLEEKIAKYAGAWSNEDTKKIRGSMTEFRRNFKFIKP
ncbi:MAG: hypothetical protein AAB535_00735 [Patescibacteria group bacterium]